MSNDNALSGRPLSATDVQYLIREAGRANLVNLSGRNLSGIELADFDLTAIDLSLANLNEADLSRAKLNKANLRGANLSGAVLTEAKLMSAKLMGVNLQGSKLRGTNLVTSYLGDANLSGADLSEAILIGANLKGANLTAANLHEANLRGTNLSGTNLRGTNLTDANLVMADLSGANLSNADLSRTDLSGANLSGANLSNANLNSANLAGVNLVGTILAGAKVDQTDFSKVDLTNVDFSGVNMAGAYLTQSQKETLVTQDILGLDNIIEVKATSQTDGNSNLDIRLKMNEQPLSVQNLAASLVALTALHTKCWLIAKGRSTDLISYSQNRDFRLANEAQMVVAGLTYDPIEITLKADVSPTGVSEALAIAIDSVAQTPPKEAEAKRMGYALEAADKMISKLQPETDTATKGMLSQFLMPELLQLGEAKGLERSKT